MIETEKALVVDVDGTLCPIRQDGESYDDMIPEPRMLARLRASRRGLGDHPAFRPRHAQQ